MSPSTSTATETLEPSNNSSGAAPAAWRRLLLPLGHFFFKVRDLLFPLVFVAAVLLTRPRRPFGSARWDLALDLLGIAVALSGQALRAAVIGFAYVRRGGKNRRIAADDLAQEGFFAHSRNPLYLGNFLALVGFCLIHNSPLAYAVAVPFFALAYLAIVVAEEDFLLGRFGAEYAAYCRRVPRFVPRLAGLRATLAGLDFDGKRLLRKEYGSTFAGITCILVLLVWDARFLEDPAAARRTLEIAALVWLPAVVAYLWVRRLKKSGALGRG